MAHEKNDGLLSELPSVEEVYGDGTRAQLSPEEILQLERCLEEINKAVIMYDRKSVSPIIVKLPTGVSFRVVRVLREELGKKGFTGDTSFYQNDQRAYWEISMW